MATRQLPALPVSTGLLDTDLLHTRQGATDKSLTGEKSKQAHGGIIPWTIGFPFLIGGYTDRNGLLYKAVQANVGQDPELDVTNTYWEPASLAGNVNLKSNTALSDAAATLTAAQLIGGEFTITPTVARIQTTDTAANIIAAFAGSVDNSNFETTIINLAAFDVTIAAGTGVTLVGNMVVNDGSATFRVRRLTSSTVSVTRLETGSGSASNIYTSPDQTITSGGGLTLTHGLAARPTNIRVQLVCQSNNLGYLAGYVRNMSGDFCSDVTSDSRGLSLWTENDTEIKARFGNSAEAFIISNATTGARAPITNANWKVRIIAKEF